MNCPDSCCFAAQLCGGSPPLFVLAAPRMIIIIISVTSIKLSPIRHHPKHWLTFILFRHTHCPPQRPHQDWASLDRFIVFIISSSSLPSLKITSLFSRPCIGYYSSTFSSSFVQSFPPMHSLSPKPSQRHPAGQ